MYTVTFSDGTTFQGDTPSDSKWDEIPKKPIKSIVYSLTPFIKYSFSDFDAYNHCVERVRGVNKTFEKITKVVIMGRTKNRIYQIMMDDSGGVFQLVVADGKEYSPRSRIVDGKFAGWDNGKPLGGWIVGIQDGSPRLEKVFVKNDSPSVS